PVALRAAVPPVDNEALSLESTATPQCRAALALPLSQRAELSVPITPSSTLVPARASTHRSEAFAAACEVADAVACGADDRKRRVNHSGWPFSILSLERAFPQPQGNGNAGDMASI